MEVCFHQLSERVVAIVKVDATYSGCTRKLLERVENNMDNQFTKLSPTYLLLSYQWLELKPNWHHNIDSKLQVGVIQHDFFFYPG